MFSLFKNALVSLITALQGIFVAQIPVAPIPTPVVVQEVTQEEVASGVDEPIEAPPSATTTPTPAPTPDIISIIGQLEQLKEEIIASTPEPTPTPQIIVVHVTPLPTPTPVLTPVAAPVPTPTPEPTPLPNLEFKFVTLSKSPVSKPGSDAKFNYRIQTGFNRERQMTNEESEIIAKTECMYNNSNFSWPTFISKTSTPYTSSLDSDNGIGHYVCTIKLLSDQSGTVILDQETVEFEVE